MSHKTFKVTIILEDLVENFYIKHFVDDFQPVFSKFKNLVFQRNPGSNVPALKIYWIDAENDKILISCEEDFRLYIEQGVGKKIFFSVQKSPQVAKLQVEDEVDEGAAMEADESGDNYADKPKDKMERKTRKLLARDDEKQKRAAKRLAEKMRNAEEKVRSEEERRARNPDKYERKNAERLERAKKRCDQIRQIITSIDPANLNNGNPESQAPGFNVGASTSATAFGTTVGASAQASLDPSLAVLHPSAETIRLLSNAIAGCLQPCNLINKILNEIIGMVPQPAGDATASNDQQQQTEVPVQAHMATNTSDVNTPTAGRPTNQEIEALFKEAARELEKMNEIVKTSKPSSMESSVTGITQIERPVNISDSVMSDVTLVDFRENTPEIDVEEQSKVVTPPKSMRSRESSIEVHDVNSMMSDDSRDWQMVDATGNESEDPSINFPENKNSVETQTAAVPVSQDQIQASIETAEKISEIMKNSIAAAQASLNKVPAILESVPTILEAVSAMPAMSSTSVVTTTAPIVAEPVVAVPEPVVVPAPVVVALPPAPAPVPTAPKAPEVSIPVAAPNPPVNAPSTSFMYNRNISQANANAARKPESGKEFGKAVIVYDPNPRVNASVHQMISMGFSNEGGWLTQLLIQVDGDVVKAINFLTPQPKNKKP